MPLVKAGVVVLDCAEPERLAAFYKELLEAEETEATANRVEIRSPDGTRLAFRRDMNATPPSGRAPRILQAHLEFVVDDLDAAERRVVTLGSLPTEASDPTGPSEYRGCTDPAGHSFTLRRTTPSAPKQG
ncbi:VOC domain-containing protein OS=Streptomyces glaucescens OX=1907 GN=SGLAU_29935 PE=4 SV=1 [Streptomyces glaucescens]